MIIFGFGELIEYIFGEYMNLLRITIVSRDAKEIRCKGN